METRNHKKSGNSVVCEINHPDLGWIEYTATPDDIEPFGREVWAAVSGMNVTEIAAPTTLDVNQECERRICLIVGAKDKAGALAKQINYGNEMQAMALQAEAGEALTEQQSTRRAAILAGYHAVQRIVAASNEITALEPIPTDFEDDKYWPQEAK